MTTQTLASLAAYCQVCRGLGVVVLKAHYVAECDLPTPVPVICPHCSSDLHFPIHHYFPKKAS